MKQLQLKHARPLARLVQERGGRFSTQLGIDLDASDAREVFKWFLAAVLFGARIPESIAIRTYNEFERQRLVTPQKILAFGWDGLVSVLDQGGYVRYDFKTATKLLDVSRELVGKYDGDLNQLQVAAADSADLERLLKALGKGIGDVTVNIFLRELRGIWPKAEPLPSELVLLAAKHLRLLHHLGADQPSKRAAVTLLKRHWTAERNKAEDFADFETALVRLGLELRRKSTRFARDKAGTRRGPSHRAPESGTDRL